MKVEKWLCSNFLINWITAYYKMIIDIFKNAKEYLDMICTIQTSFFGKKSTVWIFSPFWVGTELIRHPFMLKNIVCKREEMGYSRFGLNEFFKPVWKLANDRLRPFNMLIISLICYFCVFTGMVCPELLFSCFQGNWK